MEKHFDREGIWAFVGKASAILTIVAALVTILSYCGGRAPRVVAQCESFFIQGKLLVNSVDSKTMQSLCRDNPTGDPVNTLKSKSTSSSIDTEVNSYQATALEYINSRIDFDQSREYSCIKCTVKNLGEIEASGIMITMPDRFKSAYLGGIPYIIRPGMNGLKGIEIGNMRPDDEIDVVVWVEGRFLSRFSTIKILTKEGVGKLFFPYQVDGYLGSLINSYRDLVLMVPVLLLVILFGIFVWVCEILKQNKKEDEKKQVTDDVSMK